MPIAIATMTPSSTACAAACAAPCSSFSPAPPRTTPHRAEAGAGGDGMDDLHHRLGDADGGHGVGADARHVEDVDDGEQRFHRHLEDHRHRQHHQRRAHGPFGVIAIRSADRFDNQRPPALHEIDLSRTWLTRTRLNPGPYGEREKSRRRKRTTSRPNWPGRTARWWECGRSWFARRHYMPAAAFFAFFGRRFGFGPSS